MKTLLNLQRVDLGFNAERLVLAAVDIGSQDYTDAAGTAFYQELLGRIRALPGVESASLAFSIPFGGSNMADDVFLADGKRFNVRMNAIGLDYFRSMSIPLLRGRDFNERDRAGSPGVAIINDALAERFWPGEDPLGKRVRMYDPRGSGPTIEVIGVVKNGRYYRAWRDPEQPFMFLPFTQQYLPNMTLHIRCQGAVGAVITGLRRELQRLNNKLAAQDVRTMPEAMARAVILERTGAGLISLFGFLALAIAAFGIFGVVSFTVSQRTHEIGIRIALGARKQDILRLIGRQCVTPVFLGIIFGGLAAIMLSRIMSKLLYGVDAIDLTTYLLATTVLIGVGLLACFLPARRAAHVDPQVALRNE
jgi:putative ABC transport system permease protein